MSQQRKITWAEVAQNAKNNWIVVDGMVIDANDYLNDHPGGPAVIQNRGGKDATKDVNDTGHTRGARDKMKQHQIGVIDETSVAEAWQLNSSQSINPAQVAMFLIAIVAMIVIVKFVL